MLSKLCRKCNATKPVSDFNKASRESDGLQDRCRQCNKEYAAWYRATHVEKERLRHAKYHEANKAKINKRVSNWQKQNGDKCRAKSRKFHHSHKESEAARMKAWEEKNPDWKRNYTKKWRSDNIEHRKAYDDQYWRNNKSLVYAKNARRRASKFQATPAWADKKGIVAIYAECVRISEETGIEHHVDHIVPLRSKIVCGLHCEANLQIITGPENSRKHNSYWPNMP